MTSISSNAFLQKSAYLFAVLGGITAVVNSFRNAMRASTGCGEYSTSFVYHDALTGSALFIIPAAILLFIVKISWQKTSFTVAALLATTGYFAIVVYSFLHSELTRYAPCDHKGDDQSLGLFILGMIGVPFVWIIVWMVLELMKFLLLHLRR